MSSNRASNYLTKTRYVNGLACAKWLWLDIHARERLPKADESAQFLMDQGRRIGELARERYPDGTLLPPVRPKESDQQSRKLLDKREPLFEAGFLHPNGTCYARADVLVPAGQKEWDVVEVKSGTSVKAEYLHDVAFQRYCYIGAGLEIRDCSLLLIDTAYERSGEVEPLRLFHQVKVTAEVDKISASVEPSVERLLDVARLSACPEFAAGEAYHKDEAGVHADDAIWRAHPGSDILDLYRGGKLAVELLESGVFRIRDIPSSAALRGRQIIQRAAHSSGQVHVDREKLVDFLARLTYPLHFLDFETINPAIPPFDGARPYQQIPFQFSVHVVNAPGHRAVHHSYLATDAADPREKLFAFLRRVIGPTGTIVAYNDPFEKRILADLSSRFPDHRDWVDAASTRFVDLITPFKEFSFYSPAQAGSASLKDVLPAVTGRGYEGFEIANGSQASIAFLAATFGRPDGSHLSSAEVGEIRRALEKYCGRDTEGMVCIIEKLTQLTGRGN